MNISAWAAYVRREQTVIRTLRLEADYRVASARHEWASRRARYAMIASLAVDVIVVVAMREIRPLGVAVVLAGLAIHIAAAYSEWRTSREAAAAQGAWWAAMDEIDGEGR